MLGTRLPGTRASLKAWNARETVGGVGAFKSPLKPGT